MSIKIRNEIVAVLAEHGGRFAAPMLHDVGVFDVTELEDAWSHDEIWASMFMALSEFHFEIGRRSPLSFVLPTEKQFFTVRSVAEMLASQLAQSHFVKFEGMQSVADEVMVMKLINMVSKPEYCRKTVLAFLCAYSRVFGESNLLLSQLELAQCRRNVSHEEILDILWTYSSPRMAGVVSSSKASKVGGA